MKNLSLSRLLLTFVAAAALIFATTAWSCSTDDCNKKCAGKTGADFEHCVAACKDDKKQQFVAYAMDISQAFKSARTHILTLKPELTKVWDTGTATADKLIAAVKASSETEVLKLVAELIPVINEAAQAFTGNVTVLTILALADIGLHFFVNHYTPPKSGRMSGNEQVVNNYKARPTWGCQYRPDRCK